MHGSGFLVPQTCFNLFLPAGFQRAGRAFPAAFRSDARVIADRAKDSPNHAQHEFLREYVMQEFTSGR